MVKVRIRVRIRNLDVMINGLANALCLVVSSLRQKYNNVCVYVCVSV